MCGIFAAISATQNALQQKPQLDRLHHRGPNKRGSRSIEISWGHVSLGMTRLAIVDQSDIEVPYHYPKMGVTLAYNGEVYNWNEVKTKVHLFDDELQQYTSKCDAEAVAGAWRIFGPDALDDFNGMWGFVLVDHWKNEVFIARDRAGEKPVYYAHRNGVLYVVSEIKAFPFDLERAPCPDMDALEFDCLRSTPFKDVQALEPGHYILLENPEDVLSSTPKRWWALPEERFVEAPKDEIVDELTELLVDAIRIRHVSEVPVAVQLSGGLDSAIVQAVAQSENLYCVTFPDDGVDNMSMAQEASGGLGVQPVSFTREELLEALPGIAYHLDTPATWTAVCQWFMNCQISADGNVIVLSGEGADELFGGYSRYRILWWLDRMRLDDPLLESYGPLIRRVLGSPEDVLVDMLNRGDSAGARRARALIRTHSSGDDLAARMARVDFYSTMQVLLRMADRMAAAFSLENRAPFLDYRVMALSATIPTSMKITDHYSKAILRQVARRVGVPEVIVEEKTKKGLFVPPSWGRGRRWDRAWFRDEINSAWEKSMLSKGEGETDVV